ncbi:Nramp family divalent metal transporter [Aureispira anguillae]|uniref:Nramp family divalent metal transporter n=1 Tax=Aureispira anguillae TaxID=2864201 RepID=A0A915VJX5_9BACT|nr:Nramp family divalent metal transporter [Aureispira anguillae]BDS09402.1 Nramp family divalent metal transporter [Aureispira anguillae]
MLSQFKKIGPGAMVAAAFIGPGTITTATLAGSSYGYTLLWAVLFSVVATYILQEMAARLGVIGGMGIGQALRIKIQNPILKMGAAILVIGAILIGNAAYEAGNITGAVLGFNDYFPSYPFNPLVILIGAIALLVLWIGKYQFIERFLVLLVASMGFIFLVAAIAVRPNLGAILAGLCCPSLPNNSLLMVMGLIGTTVVPYNLFLHASSSQKRWAANKNLKDAHWDLTFSILLGGLITMAILITAAATVHTSTTTIQSAQDLSKGLVPLLGNWAGLFLSLGFFAAGLSSAITAPLAAAFATSEILGWEKKLTAANFRLTWMLVLLIGLIFSCLGFKPTLVILFAQISNGLLLPIIALFLLWVMNDKTIMGKQVNSQVVNCLAMLIILTTLLLGTKGILAAIGWF